MISRKDTNVAKDFLKQHISKIDTKKLTPEVRKATEHILGQFDKWYLSYAPEAAPNPAKKKRRSIRKD